MCIRDRWATPNSSPTRTCAPWTTPASSSSRRHPRPTSRPPPWPPNTSSPPRRCITWPSGTSATAPELRGRWRVREDTMAMAPPKATKGPTLVLRRVFVWSSTRTGAAQLARTKKLARASDDLARLERGLGGRHYPDAQAVQQRVSAIGTARHVIGYLQADIGTDPATGKPILSWHFDDDALTAEAATDGWYALLTNLDPETADAAEVLRRYKGQEAVERRYSSIKGPLAVGPHVPEEQPAHRSPHH